MKTHYRELTQENVEWKDWPIPLTVFPNSQGINLCQIQAISWTELENGMPVSMTVHYNAEVPNG